ncbi:MAG: hypothetical protein Q8J76_07180 [Desulfobulbaceae bacterium]|nr:hypothetical protein [Desulfobulbaceae bacterium]
MARLRRAIVADEQRDFDKVNYKVGLMAINSDRADWSLLLRPHCEVWGFGYHNLQEGNSND